MANSILAVCAVEFDPPGLAAVPSQLWDEELVLVLPINHPSRSRSIASYTHEDFILLFLALDHHPAGARPPSRLTHGMELEGGARARLARR